MAQKLISIIIPVLNEAANLDALIARVTGVLAQVPEAFEIVFVDDGSTDGTLAKLRACHAQDPRITAISFSRNFGKELAIAAGLTYVRGDAAIIMDADLQHPPEIALKFIEKWRDGIGPILVVIGIPMLLHSLYDTSLKRDMNWLAMIVAAASFGWLAFLSSRLYGTDDVEANRAMLAEYQRRKKALT